MHIVDITIFAVYMITMLGVGFFFYYKNEGTEDYYVGGRKMTSWHVGLSVVATDVGGGFSVGLGGLGFVMGLSGSWMLFTGLIGAWLAAVFLIPVVKGNRAFDKFYTLPQIFGHYFDKKTALLAGIISAIGYTGFTSSQVLAGAKLASGTFAELDINKALLIMGAVAVVYTVLGGIKAVIYTDTVQWIILMSGLIFIGLPISYTAVGGWDSIKETVAPGMLSFTNVSWQQLVNWAVTIIPIWFVAMTLYQRIYASRDEKTARRAWYIAGIFEWPIMALMGVSLGLLAKVGADQGMFDYLGAENISDTDPETGLPMLLRTVLPVGLMGLMMSAYFSAVLSTADSCLMAASGNVVSDLLCRLFNLNEEGKSFMLISQGTTLLLGLLAVGLAWKMTSVLDLMLYSYAFLVSGLLVPILGALFWKKRNPTAAFVAMLVGGSTTVGMTLLIPTEEMPLGLDANVFGILAAFIIFATISYVMPNKTVNRKSLKYT